MLLEDISTLNFPDIKTEPYPYFEADGLFYDNVLDEVIKSFPYEDDPRWRGSRHYKMEMGGNYDQMPPYIKEVLEPLSSDRFCDILAKKFSTPPLVPVVHGAGIHISLQDTNLPFHVDWQKYGRVYRWVNLHVYLNKDWKEGDGGEFMLTGDTIIKIPPTFNKTVCYYSSAPVRHGHPDYWKPEKPRMCLSMYYFSDTPSNDFLAFKKTDEYRRNRLYYGLD